MLEARALPPAPGAAGGAAAAVTVRCERQRGTTPRAPHAAADVAWPPAAATFAFRVTEVTSDVNFAVVYRHEREGPLSVLGEACLPLPLLLAPDPAAAAAALRAGAPLTVAAPPRWTRLLPPRAPGDPFSRAGRSEGGGDDVIAEEGLPRGLLRYEASLTLHRPAAWCYLVPQALPPGAARGSRGGAARAADAADAPPGPHAAAAALAAAARLTDAALALLAAPLRTALYLQSFQQPTLNAALLALLSLACLHAWHLARAAWPLWLAAAPLLNGCARRAQRAAPRKGRTGRAGICAAHR